jgi:hypothetical protein
VLVVELLVVLVVSVLKAPLFFVGEGLLMASAGRAVTAVAFEARCARSPSVSLSISLAFVWWLRAVSSGAQAHVAERG